MKLYLFRDYQDDRVTLGRLFNPNDDHGWQTLERPWKDNQKTISCIPDGIYVAELDMYYGGDGVGGNQDYPAYELRNVPNRTEIKIHIGNYVRNVVGCIALGTTRDADHPAVWSSGKAFKDFMDYMDGVERFKIDIQTTQQQ